MTFKIKETRINVTFFFALSLCIIASNKMFEDFVIAFISSLIHEIAHVLSLISYGEKLKSISFTAFGIDIRRYETLKLSYKQEIAALLFGPFINLMLALILKLLSLLYNSRFFLNAYYINLGLSIFNLLPISPLDGGRALYFYLCTKTNEEYAKRISENIGLFVLFPLFLFGFYILTQNKYNYSLLVVCIYLCIYLLLDKNIIQKHDKLLQSSNNYLH